MPKLRGLRKCLNFLTIKHSHDIYVAPHHNAFIDNYSIDNPNSDNVLAYVNYLRNTNKELKLRLFVETTKEMERFNNGNIEIIPVLVNENGSKTQKIKLSEH